MAEFRLELIRQLVSGASAARSRGIAALQHEAFNHAVEGRVVIMAAAGEIEEVRARGGLPAASSMETSQVVIQPRLRTRKSDQPIRATDGWMLILDFNYTGTNSTAPLGTFVQWGPLRKLAVVR